MEDALTPLEAIKGYADFGKEVASYDWTDPAAVLKQCRKYFDEILKQLVIVNEPANSTPPSIAEVLTAHYLPLVDTLIKTQHIESKQEQARKIIQLLVEAT